MNKKDFELLIEKYKKDENYEKLIEILEKQIIIFYSYILRKKGINFVFRSRIEMLEDIRANLSIEHIVNFSKFFELGLNDELTDKEMFEELETVYVDMYSIEEE